MRFQVIMSNLKMNNFTMPTTFHGPTIGYHDLKIIDNKNIAIGFLGNVTMKKIVGATTVNKDDDLPLLNIANELEGLWGREDNEGMKGNKWVKLKWVSRLLGSIRKGDLVNKGNYHIIFRNIFGDGHNFFLFLTLVP
jgi:hypothetical protein